MFEHSGPQGKHYPDNDSESLSSYSSNTSEAAEYDDMSMENFLAQIITSKKSSLSRKLKKWSKDSDDWKILQGEYLIEKRSE